VGKKNPVPINSKNNYLSNSIEYFSLSSKEVNQHSIQSMIMVSINILCVMVNKDLTTQLKKPLELIKDLVRKHSNEGDLVLDTFAGTGTTAHAAFY
jgi:DNA modification methylase